MDGMCGWSGCRLLHLRERLKCRLNTQYLENPGGLVSQVRAEHLDNPDGAAFQDGADGRVNRDGRGGAARAELAGRAAPLDRAEPLDRAAGQDGQGKAGRAVGLAGQGSLDGADNLDGVRYLGGADGAGWAHHRHYMASIHGISLEHQECPMLLDGGCRAVALLSRLVPAHCSSSIWTKALDSILTIQGLSVEAV